MQAINLTEFNQYILDNRFISGKEVAWFKNKVSSVKLLAVIIECGQSYEAVIYKLRRGQFFELEKFQKFDEISLAYDYLEYELTY